jgi:hypothetical protein
VDAVAVLAVSRRRGERRLGSAPLMLLLFLPPKIRAQAVSFLNTAARKFTYLNNPVFFGKKCKKNYLSCEQLA